MNYYWNIINERDINMQYQKDYICILIIEYLNRLIELYWKTQKSLDQTDKKFKNLIGV